MAPKSPPAWPAGWSCRRTATAVKRNTSQTPSTAGRPEGSRRSCNGRNRIWATLCAWRIWPAKPRQWLLHQRRLAAQMRLEKTDDGIDAIAEAVGLQTAATLRQHFSRTLDTTPTAYRRRVSTA